MRTAMAKKMVSSTMPMVAVGDDLASPIFFSEEYLARRFSRLAKVPVALTCEITRDPGYLHQYFLLRSDTLPKWMPPIANSDMQDEDSEIMVARLGNHVIAGARLTFSMPTHRRPLPMETLGFGMERVVQDLSVSRLRYAEISRLVMLPEFEGSAHAIEFVRHIIKYCTTKKVSVAFSLLPLPVAERCKKALALFGLNWSLRSDMMAPQDASYEGQIVFSIADLRPLHAPKPRPKAMVSEVELFATA